MTRTIWIRLYALLLLAMMSAGCDLVQGIFKAGFVVGLVVVVVVIGVVLFLISKMRG